MKKQIIVDQNVVIIGENSINLDCSQFKNQFNFCEINENEKWIEKVPFKGREDLKSWKEVEKFIQLASIRLDKPSDIHKWDEVTESWIEDEELKKESEKQKKLYEIYTLKKYLIDTDFYYVRKLETNEDIPVEVIENRLKTRQKIRELEDSL